MTTTTTFAASVDAERAKYVVIGGCRVTVGALDDFWSEQGERFSLRTSLALAVLDARLRRAGAELGEVFHVARDGEVSAPSRPVRDGHCRADRRRVRAVRRGCPPALGIVGPAWKGRRSGSGVVALPLAVRVTVCYDRTISNTNHQGAATMNMARIDACVDFILDLIEEVTPGIDATREAAALTDAAADALAESQGVELTALEALCISRMISMYLQGALDQQAAQPE